jgi:ribosomal protein S18 acetylase RimI-like enzyme
MTVQPLMSSEAAAANDVLIEAFADYPVMRHVLGESATPAALRTLVELFTASRWMRAHPVLGAHDGRGRLVGVITLTPPGDFPVPPALGALAERTWGVLGEAARARYEAIKAAWSATAVAGQRWHVNMLGVSSVARAKGYGEALLTAARTLSGTAGLDLTTEDPANLAYYRRRGFEIVAQAQLNAQLSTWTLVTAK